MNKGKSTVEFGTTPGSININPPNKITLSSPGTTTNLSENMNKEISDETKAKVFAQYLGQVYDCRNYRYKLNSVGVVSGLNNGHKFEDCTLHLIPLSKITDEDAIELLNIRKMKGVFKKDYEIEKGKESIATGDTSYSFNVACEIIQYLQSRGYDLPNYHLNGQTLIQANLALDKTLITK